MHVQFGKGRKGADPGGDAVQGRLESLCACAVVYVWQSLHGCYCSMINSRNIHAYSVSLLGVDLYTMFLRGIRLHSSVIAYTTLTTYIVDFKY